MVRGAATLPSPAQSAKQRSRGLSVLQRRAAEEEAALARDAASRRVGGGFEEPSVAHEATGGKSMKTGMVLKKQSEATC